MLFCFGQVAPVQLSAVALIGQPFPLSGILCRCFSVPVKRSSRYALPFIQGNTNKGILQPIKRSALPPVRDPLQMLFCWVMCGHVRKLSAFARIGQPFPCRIPCRCFSAPVRWSRCYALQLSRNTNKGTLQTVKRSALPPVLRSKIGLFCFFDAAGRCFFALVRWSRCYALPLIQEQTNKGTLQAVSGCPVGSLADAFLSFMCGNCQRLP